MATIPIPLPETSSAEFLPVRLRPEATWHADAPESLTAYVPWDEDTGGWAAWASYLRHRAGPRPMTRLFKSRQSPLNWSLTSGNRTAMATVSLIAQLYYSGEKSTRRSNPLPDIEQWLVDADAGPMSPAAALEHLAWVWSLPRLARYAPAGLWWRLLEQLLRAAYDASESDLCEDPLTHQLLAGELSLTLARQFPELDVCHERAAAGNGAVGEGLMDLVNERGLADPRHVELLRPLLGCWTRCRLIAGDLGCDSNDDNDDGYRPVLLQSLRLTRFDGTQALTFGLPSEWNAEMFKTALQCGASADLVRIAADCLPPLDLPTPKPRPQRPPSPASGSEPARLAILRSNWSRRSELLAVSFAGQTVRTELNIGRDQLWAGDWELTVRTGGQLAGPAGEWEEVCWFSDEDVDYLELECALEHGLRVQRQFLLARGDRILFLADAVLGTVPQNLEYRSTLPLLPGVAFLAAEETREGRIAARKQQALALPLALPEWRSDPRGGTLALNDGRLELRQLGAGSSLYAPLFLDLDRRRRKRPVTWRRLTVADGRAIQPADVAAGYRVQIGAEQWLIYRSLAPRKARTVLGQHVSTEFLLGRFTRRGEVQQLLEVE